MTIKPEVLAAMDYIDSSGFKGAPIWKASWQTIRAELLAMDAEIELLRVGTERNLLHAQMAESRLTAAHALLRECRRLSAHFFRTPTPDDLYEKIEAHLSEPRP